MAESNFTVADKQLAEALNKASDEMLAAYLRGDCDGATRTWLAVFEHFNRTAYGVFDETDRGALTSFLVRFLTVVTQDDYVVDRRFLGGVVGSNPVLANLLSVTSIGSTEPYLDSVVGRKNDLYKICLLLNARVEGHADLRRHLFDRDSVVASAWLCGFSYSAWGLMTPTVIANIRAAFSGADERLRYIGDISVEPYFAVSYVCPEAELKLKALLNRSIRAGFSGVRIENRPQRGRIAILSQRWKKGTAVYKILCAFVAALKPHYHLTLVHLGDTTGDPIAAEGFDRVLHVSIASGTKLDLKQIDKNDFELAFFPDIGMSVESILLSNLRIAPIQCASYGHSASTGGALVDYWIGGRDAEPDLAPQENYSERLILIPGSGGPPTIPMLAMPECKKNADRIVVNCPCGAYKLNFELVQCLKEIAENCNKAGRKVHFRFFAAKAAFRLARYAAVLSDLALAFDGKATFEVFNEINYEGYMRLLGSGHFTLDSFPFGGCNSIIDVLWLRQPLVTRYGERWNNRYGMALLKRLGLSEMAVANRDDYVALGTRLACDDAYRSELECRIAAVDLEGRAWDPEESQSFKRAIDFIIANHERIKGDPVRTPILVN